MLENIENPSLFEPSAIVAAGITIVIATVIWYYGFAGNWRGFFFGYGLREKKNLSLKDFLDKIKPEISLFIREGCELYLKNDGNLIQWIKEAAQKGVQVKILLGPKSNMTFALENSNNVTLYRTEEEQEKGFILVGDEGFFTAFIQERLKGQKIENTYTPTLYPGPRAGFLKEFDELSKRANIVKL